MFPQHLRVTVQAFRSNPQPSRRYTRSFGTIQTKVSPSPTIRIGIVTPKRIDKRSSARHHSRRLLVETIRPLLPKLGGGVEMLITLSRRIQKEELEQLSKELELFFQTSGLLVK